MSDTTLRLSCPADDFAGLGEPAATSSSTAESPRPTSTANSRPTVDDRPQKACTPELESFPNVGTFQAPVVWLAVSSGVHSAAGLFVVPARSGKEAAVLFHVTWEFIDTSEDGIRRSLGVFSQWQPPAGAEFKGFYGFADGGGGVALIEAESAAALARTTAPWAPWLRFTTNPIVPIEESSTMAGEAVAFRDSVSGNVGTHSAI